MNLIEIYLENKKQLPLVVKYCRWKNLSITLDKVIDIKKSNGYVNGKCYTKSTNYLGIRYNGYVKISVGHLQGSRDGRY